MNNKTFYFRIFAIIYYKQLDKTLQHYYCEDVMTFEMAILKLDTVKKVAETDENIEVKFLLEPVTYSLEDIEHGNAQVRYLNHCFNLPSYERKEVNK